MDAGLHTPTVKEMFFSNQWNVSHGYDQFVFRNLGQKRPCGQQSPPGTIGLRLLHVDHIIAPGGGDDIFFLVVYDYRLGAWRQVIQNLVQKWTAAYMR